MIKINLVNNEWEFIGVLKVVKIPKEGEYLYLRCESKYYMVDTIIHDCIERKLFKFLGKKVVITLMVKPIDRFK